MSGITLIHEPKIATRLMSLDFVRGLTMVLLTLESIELYATWSPFFGPPLVFADSLVCRRCCQSRANHKEINRLRLKLPLATKSLSFWHV
jgi:hypothetical protein